jgi:hypothetical protein
MGSLTLAQANAIAHWFNRFANALNVEAEQPQLSTDQVGSLTGAAESLADAAANIATKYAQVEFADADSAFREISDAAAKACSTAETLSADANKIANVLDIGAKTIALATAMASGNYGGAVSDLVALVGKPVPGSGAAPKPDS